MNRRLFITSTIATGLLPAVSFSGHEVTLRSEFTVINSGIGGNNSAEVLARIDRDCLQHKPDLTVLMIGTNDMNSKKHIALPVFTANLQKIIDGIKAVNSKILLMNLLPVYEPYLMTRHNPEFYAPEGHRGRLLRMNETIRMAADTFGIYFLDLFSLFDKIGNIGLDANSLIKNEANSGTTDGLHPTPQGYRFMALAVYDFIRYHQLPTRRIVCLGDSITYGDGSTDNLSYPGFLNKLLQ